MFCNIVENVGVFGQFEANWSRGWKVNPYSYYAEMKWIFNCINFSKKKTVGHNKHGPRIQDAQNDMDLIRNDNTC